MITEKELRKIYSWQPYRESWPIDRFQNKDSSEELYATLSESIASNSLFDSYQSENGGLANYIEFFCYPKDHSTYTGNAIQVCISLCAPIVAYGQNEVTKRPNFFGWSPMFMPSTVGIITDDNLKEMQAELLKIFASENLLLLTSAHAGEPLPQEVADEVQTENHNQGNQVLHGIFQKVD